MEHTLTSFEKTYWSKEVAGLLEISTSTLRKWSLQLEQAGYCFLRDELERRAYTERDLSVLREFQDLVGHNMTLEHASQMVSFISVPAVHVKDPSFTIENMIEQQMCRLIDYMEKQDRFNTVLLEYLQKHVERIERMESNLLTEIAAAKEQWQHENEQQYYQQQEDNVFLRNERKDAQVLGKRSDLHKKRVHWWQKLFY